MISVCIATFNAEPYIRTQLESILVQLKRDDEIIVFDDQSTDETIQIIKSMNDARIRLFQQKQRKGVINNFESALKEARGDLIFLSDQDDVWLPGKVFKCISALERHTAVVTDCKVVDERLKLISPSFFSIRQSKKGIFKNLLANSYIGCCMAFRKEVVSIALPFPKNIPMHDAWIGLVAELIGDVIFLPEPLLLYRRHNSNVSQMKSQNSLKTKLKSRALLLKEIINLKFKLLISHYR